MRLIESCKNYRAICKKAIKSDLQSRWTGGLEGTVQTRDVTVHNPFCSTLHTTHLKYN